MANQAQNIKWNIHLETGRKKRKNLSKKNLSLLVSQFEKNPKPNKQTRKELSQMIPGMTERSIQVWFQNRRTKLNLTKKRSFSGSSQENIHDSFSSSNSNNSEDSEDFDIEEGEEEEVEDYDFENENLNLNIETKTLARDDVKVENSHSKRISPISIDSLVNPFNFNINIKLDQLDLSSINVLGNNLQSSTTPTSSTSTSSYFSSTPTSPPSTSYYFSNPTLSSSRSEPNLPLANQELKPAIKKPDMKKKKVSGSLSMPSYSTDGIFNQDPQNSNQQEQNQPRSVMSINFLTQT